MLSWLTCMRSRSWALAFCSLTIICATSVLVTEALDVSKLLSFSAWWGEARNEEVEHPRVCMILAILLICLAGRWCKIYFSPHACVLLGQWQVHRGFPSGCPCRMAAGRQGLVTLINSDDVIEINSVIQYHMHAVISDFPISQRLIRTPRRTLKQSVNLSKGDSYN